MQTILGSGGSIGLELATALKQYTGKIRLVSRNPRKVNKDDELFSTDLTIGNNVDAAVKGSEVVYLTVGLKYDLKVWQETWPLLMRNVINACKKYNARMVFFDNVYMYDKDHLGNMTEDTPINPSSRKGEIRTKIAAMLMDEANKGNIKALIARSADFYSPYYTSTSMLNEMVIKRFNSGQAPMWPISTMFKHSFTYTPDAGKAVAILGNSAEAYNQVWHLPTATNPLTGKEWVNSLAEGYGKKPKVVTVSKFMFNMLGAFMPVMREIKEMLYQYERDYVFKSDKFEKKFRFSPTPYTEGIKKIIRQTKVAASEPQLA